MVSGRTYVVRRGVQKQLLQVIDSYTNIANVYENGTSHRFPKGRQ